MKEIRLKNGEWLDIESIVLEVRRELDDKYDTSVDTGTKYRNFTGLCDEAYILLGEKLKSLNVGLEVEHFHGEQQHSPAVQSRYWPYQHTWTKVFDPVGGAFLYVDATCQQFQFLYPDMPEYYISEMPPPWFLSDRLNPTFNGITRKLNQRVRVPYNRGNGNGWGRIGIVEFIQYRIWGRISDLVGRIRKYR